jgi:hypothetical protein
VKRNCPQWTVPRNPNINIVEVDWSDRRIAEACAVDNKTVASVRAQVRNFLTSTPTTRTGKDGKQYPAKRESRGWTAPEVGQ